jgi:hypothetical protein
MSEMRSNASINRACPGMSGHARLSQATTALGMKFMSLSFHHF